MEKITDEILSLITKVWYWLVLSLAGLIGKFSYDKMMGKKLSFGYVMASFGIGIFISTMAVLLCNYFHASLAAQLIIIPISSCISKELMLAIFSLDYKKYLSDIANYWAKRWKDH